MPLKFEMKAIRPWIRGKNGRKDGSRKAGSRQNGGEGSAELSAVLEAYDRRFESAVAEERTEAERKEHFRAEASRLLETVIAPALESLGGRIAEHGHDWEIESRVDIQGQPALACAFSPRNTDTNGEAANELTFRFTFPDRLVVAGSARDAGELVELLPRSYQVSDVTTEVVAEEVTRFVTRAIG